MSRTLADSTFIIFSPPRTRLSALSASNATGMDPLRMRSVSKLRIPDTMGTPKPPAPTAAPTVAAEILTTRPMRKPCNTCGMARGKRTRRRGYDGVMPMPRAESIVPGGTPCKPVTVPRKIGNTP